MTVPRGFAVAVNRQRREEQIQSAVKAAFTVTGRTAHVVRRLAVAEHVAKALRITLSAGLLRDVTRVTEAMGATKIAVGNRRLFRGVKPRGATEGEAVALAKLCRSDPRNRR